MMAAYYLYSHFNKSDAESGDYSKFANEILSLFVDYKDALYDLSFDENVQILLALNIYYKYSKSLVAKELIIDLGDFLINKFEEKDYYLDNLDDCALFSISLMESYKHTGIISFKDGYSEISEKLISLYSSDKNMFLKISDKKEIKYSCLEINLYLLCLIMYSSEDDKKNELKPIISALYRKLYVNSGLLTSWPDAPTLDVKDLDLVIVPAVAYSEDCYRLGYGGGYYDRFIERLRDDAVTVGIAFDLQIFPEVPKEPHDAQLDYIVTETRILTPNK